MGDEQEGALVLREEPLEPLDGVDVEVVGGLVQQQEVRVGEERTRKRHARELASGQREQVALQHVVRQSETLDDAADAVAVAVPPGGLEASLELLVRAHGVAQLRAVFREAGEALLGSAQRGLELHRVAERLEQVLPHGAVALQLRGLLVQPDPAATGASDGPLVGVFVAGDEAQQGRLAGAVAPDEDGVVVAVDGERDGREQPLSGIRLLDVVEGDDAHGVAAGRGRGWERQDTTGAPGAATCAPGRVPATLRVGAESQEVPLRERRPRPRHPHRPPDLLAGGSGGCA